MLALSSIFQEANDQSEKQRDVLVMVEDATLYAEKTTETEWGANTSESNVDYTSAPDNAPNAGDVILTEGSIFENYESGGDTWSGVSASFPIAIQGFQFATINTMRKFSIFAKRGTTDTDGVVKGVIYSDSGGSPGTLLASTSDVTINQNSNTWFDFEIEYVFEASTQYYVGIEYVSGAGTSWYIDTDNGYANGSLWSYNTTTWTESSVSDGYFRIYAKYVANTGYITTNNLDIGEVPTVNGEWALEDVKPTGTTLTYTAEYSTTGAWTGEEVSIGAIVDGQAITDLKRYWRVTATLTANTARDETPILQSIKADYTTYRKFNRIPDLGYEPLVEDVSSLTSKVDFFKPASIGQISVEIAMTDAVSDWVYSDTLYNKIVQVKLGFNYTGFTEADYIHYFTGAIDDWSVTDHILNLTLKDLSKEWKLPVPSKWETGDPAVTWTAQHHTDVMLDIFQNYINVRDSGLLLDSFNTVKAATSAYIVTRTITGKTEDAKKLVEELRVLLMAFFLPRGDGKIGIKLFDSTEAAATTFTDDNTLSIKWQANSKDLINQTNLYFNWDTLGDKEENFDSFDRGPASEPSTSQTNFQEIRPYILKDKWTLTAQASQISDLETKILAQFDNMPATVTITCDAKDIAYEAGDMVNVTTLEAPGSGGAGITDEKYLITSKNLDFLGDKIIFKGLKVA